MTPTASYQFEASPPSTPMLSAAVGCLELRVRVLGVYADGSGVC